MSSSTRACPRAPFRNGERFRHRGLTAVLALVLLSGCTSGGDRADARGSLETELQQTLDRWRQRDDVVAAALAVDLAGEVSWSGASGWADQKGGRPLTAEDRFRIASVTKTFVAAVVLQLVDEQKLSLDDPLTKYVSDAPHSGGVQIRQLLNHTSGIPDAQDAQWAREAVEHPDRPWSRDKLYAHAADKPRQFEPGSRFGYSNTNFLLLGDVIAAVSGSNWGQQVRARIIEPLRLSNTFVSEDEISSGGVVTGYVDNDRDGVSDNPLVGERNDGALKAFEDPAGGMISTAPDLVRFGRALFDGKLLSKSSLEQMTAGRYFTPSTGYGLGVQFSKPDLATTVVGHTGGMPAFSSALMFLPEHGLVIAALANDGSSSTFDLGELAMLAVLKRPESLHGRGLGMLRPLSP